MNDTTVDILLVEDNPSDVELVLRALQKRNIAGNTLIARDGAEALDFIFAAGQYSNRLIEEAPRVVFLDLKLPKVDGLEVLRRIKSDRRTLMIPVVMLTSSPEEQDIVSSYQLGANSYIVKPVDFDEFVQSVVDTAMYWLTLNQSPVLKFH
jgi:two-component system response regulator